MKIKQAHKERIFIVVLLVGIFALLLGNTTLSQVNKQAIADNEITTGVITVDLLNLNKAGEKMPPLITHIVPGDTLDNVVSVKNTCPYDEYIRITLDKHIFDGDEAKTLLDSSKANFLFNKEDWTYQDGYYYYNHILPAGEISKDLYNGIYLDKSMGNRYKLATLQVDIVVEAVQSVNNGASALEAEGWEIVAK